MAANTTPTDPSHPSLRQRAEAQFKVDHPPTAVSLSPAETQQVLHELQVHQIELELQNEEQRRTQTELEASQARYFDLYDLAPVGYVTLNAQGLIQQANLTAAGLLGVARGALAQQPLTHFIVPDDQDLYYRPRKRLGELGAPQTCELRLLRPDGAFFWARLEMTATGAAEGEWVGRVVISDITARVHADQERQQAETEIRQLNESLEHHVAERTAQMETTNRELRGEMAARRHIEAVLRASETSYRELAAENARLLEISQADAATKATLLHEVNHRVKNNLAAIIGLLYIEQRYLRAEDEAHCEALVSDLAGRIRSLAQVHTLLSASTWAPISLTELAEEVVRGAQTLLPRERSIQTEVSLSPVRLTPKQANALGLSLNELATNTLKYAGSDTRSTQLSVQISQTAHEISVEFRDDGPGFPEDVLHGDRRGVGLYLVTTLIESDLQGTVALLNDHGAVVRLSFNAAVND